MDAKPDNALEILSMCLQERVTAVWFAFGDDLGRWIQHVRRHEEVHTIIFVQVNSVAEALTAYREWKVDVIVVQGSVTVSYYSPKGAHVLTTYWRLVLVLPPRHRVRWPWERFSSSSSHTSGSCPRRYPRRWSSHCRSRWSGQRHTDCFPSRRRCVWSSTRDALPFGSPKRLLR